MSDGTRDLNLYGTLWRWHFLAALIVIPFVLWQSVTGTLYLWSERWIDLRYPEFRFVAETGQPRPASEQIAAALRGATSLTSDNVLPPIHTHGTVPTGEVDLEPDGVHDHAALTLPVQDILISADPRRSTVVLLQSSDGLPYAVFVNPYNATVLGVLSGGDWLPGITRALHGGWPLGKPGSWLLELGDGWAIFMIVSGVYLWWPRQRSLRECLWPRFNRGLRTAFRDLHACVAILFAAIFLFFLISALPWTAFWGQELLPRIQSALGQTSPVSFSPGGADALRLGATLPALDQVVTEARRRNVSGTLDVKLAPWPEAPFNVTNRDNPPSEDRAIVANSRTGRVIADYANGDLPTIPRLVAIGVHVHQGDFGFANVWINTAFAVSLIWLTATGLASWWVRRPKGRTGVPPKRAVVWRWPVTVSALVLCLVLPIFGASVAAAAGVDKILRLMLDHRNIDIKQTKPESFARPEIEPDG
jgi:uncharacterized iron-regulated membrane protein